MQYKGKPWKVIKCPDCGKYFKSEYSAEYHKNNAKALCPMYVRDDANHKSNS